ncbi:MAG: hypothetical protein EOO10_01460, partial [Chitinophagaceae bacterium]
MKSLLEALDKQGINLYLSDEAKKHLALDGFTPKYGARQISGVIRNQLRRPISKYIIAGEVKKGNTVSVRLEQAALAWAIE